jgi:AraC family transcriptional regulator
MNPRLINSKDILIIGMRANISFQTINQETGQLARQFMPRRYEIKSRVGSYSFSIQNYDSFDFKTITPTKTFEKWVGVEVSDTSQVPEAMEVLSIEAGHYLVFNYKGSDQDFPKFWQQLHAEWLPNSEFHLDNRPHFEKLPEGYNPMSLENEEEVWVPVK